MSATLTTGPEKRYATALFELSKESKSLDSVTASLQIIGNVLAENSVFNNYLQSPVVNGEDKTTAVLEVATACKANALVTKFIKFVGQEHRLNLLAGILFNFQNIVEADAGIVKVQVATAHALSASQQKDIAAIAKKLAKDAKEISIQETIDPNLIAGVRLQVGSTAWDSTLKAQLEKLKQTLSE